MLGSLYAARLKESGQQMTILARGKRLEEILQRGILLENALTKERTHTVIDAVSAIQPDDDYDLILVIVRKSQVASVLPELRANWNTPNVLFLMNNAAGTKELEVVGKERLLIGFPAAGGTRQAGVVRYFLAKNQATSIGEPDGRITRRLDLIADVLRGAGFKVVVRRDMDAWLRTHVALVSPAANAIYMAGGDFYRLIHDQETLRLWVRAVREGFRVLRSLRIPVTPSALSLLEWIPEGLLIRMLQKRLDNELAELVIARHANAARDEMKILADEFQDLVRQAGIPAPAIEQLYQFVNKFPENR